MLQEIISHLVKRGGANVKELSELTGVHRNYLRYYLEALVDLRIVRRVGGAFIPSMTITWRDPQKLQIKKDPDNTNSFYIVETEEDYEHSLAKVVVEKEVKLSFFGEPDIWLTFEEPILKGTVEGVWDNISRVMMQSSTRDVVPMLLNLQAISEYPESRIELLNPTEFWIEISFPRVDENPERAVEALEDQLIRAVLAIKLVGSLKLEKVVYEE